jgi:hypothetical protein
MEVLVLKGNHTENPGSLSLSLSVPELFLCLCIPGGESGANPSRDISLEEHFAGLLKIDRGNL